MLKTSKLISLLLVVAMVLSVFSVAVVSAGAATEAATIVFDGQTVNAHVGDTITYKAYMDVTSISTATDGRIHVVDAVTYYDQSKLTIVDDSIDCYGVLNDPAIGTDVEDSIYYNDRNINKGFLFDADSAPLISVSFTVDAAGTSTIDNQILTLTKAENNRLKYFYVRDGEALTEEQPTYRSTLDVECPHADEPTEEPSTDKAVVTLHGLFGQTETKEFNVGDEFAVYTTLNVADTVSINSDTGEEKPSNGGIGSLNGNQTFTGSILEITDEQIGGEIIDIDTMFPITKSGTVANIVFDEDALYFNASTPSIVRPFRFDSDEKILVLSHYKVTAPGQADIYTNFITLAIADDDLTRIVDDGDIIQDNFSLISTFEAPEERATEAPATEAPVPTEAPATEAPVPTEAPATEAPVPTEAPATEAPVPTEAPATEAPVPTEAPATEAPVPTDKAIVTLHGLFGQTDTREFNIGDEFAVYTTLNTADTISINSDTGEEMPSNGGIGSLNGTQTYTGSILEITDEQIGGEIIDIDAMFPITKSGTVANIVFDEDALYFNASTPSIVRPFRFDSDEKILVLSHYKVTALGQADIYTNFVTLAIADDDLTRIVDDGDIIQDNFSLISTFDAPEARATEAPATEAPVPTEAPATEAPVTEAPVTEAPKPTETEAPAGEAIVTIYGLTDGQSETRTYQVGDTFEVYTTLDTSKINDGKIGSLKGEQTYTSSVLTYADAMDNGEIIDLETVFPITKDASLGNGSEPGVIVFNASTPSIENAFVFENDNSVLIKTTYTVTAPGEAEIRTNLETLAVADEDLTRIISRGEILNDNFAEHLYFELPQLPTEAPETEAPVTEAPETEAPVTEAPETEAPVTEAPETEAPATEAEIDKVHVTIYGIDGESEDKTFDFGDTFTTYTTLNASDILSGKIASISGKQTYTSDYLTLIDEVDAEGAITNLTEVFPITGEKTLGNAATIGEILFNASTPSMTSPFLFDSDDDILIQTTYKVVDNTKLAPVGAGETAENVAEAEIRTTLKTLASADEDLTRIVDNYDVVNPDFVEHMTFTQPEAQPTEAQPTETTAPEQAVVTIYGLDGKSETRTYNIGDTFTVYTTLNAKDIEDGKIAAFSGTQTYTDSILALADDTDDEGAIVNLTEVFPISGEKSLGNAANSGSIIFNASTPSITSPFVFDSDDDVLIQTTYTVTAGGEAEIRTTLKTLAVADEDLTRIVDHGDAINDNFIEHMTFDLPVPEETEAPVTEAPVTEAPETEAPVTEAPETEAPVTEAPETEAPVTEAPETEAPVTEAPETEAPDVTEAPVTEAPVTEAPDVTEAPVTEAPDVTEAPQTAKITIYGLNDQSEVKEFNVGDTFTVYTTLNAKDISEGGKIANVNGTQTYTDSILKLVGSDDDTMFPIINKDNNVVVNTETTGKILYNASTPSIDNAFVFDSDDDCIIVTTYTVTAPGEGEVRNALKTLAAADELLTPLVKNGDQRTDKPVDVKAVYELPEAPTEAPATEAPVTEAPETEAPETEAPVTEAPETEAPVTEAPETEAPVTEAPVTEAPETEAPATEAPVTEAPETEAPATEAPATEAPATEAPATEAPATEAPATEAPTPSGDKIYINADGNVYEVTAGSTHTYTYYLNNSSKVCGIDASTTWDVPTISIVGAPDFPVLNGLADFDDPDEGGNVVLNDTLTDAGKLIYNYTNAEGADFDNDDARLITMTIKVADDAQPGMYYITTSIKTLEGEEEERQIFEGVDVHPEVITRREGVLDDEDPDYKFADTYTATPANYTQGSYEPVVVIVTGDNDPAHTYSKFRTVYVDGVLYDYTCYDKAEGEDGSLILAFNGGVFDDLATGDHTITYVFADGEVDGTLTIAEADATEAPTTAGDETVGPTDGGTTPAATVAGTSGTSGGSTSTNGSAVQTGSPEIAIIFVMILVMAAGVIIFAKKRKMD